MHSTTPNPPKVELIYIKPWNNKKCVSLLYHNLYLTRSLSKPTYKQYNIRWSKRQASSSLLRTFALDWPSYLRCDSLTQSSFVLKASSAASKRHWLSTAWWSTGIRWKAQQRSVHPHRPWASRYKCSTSKCGYRYWPSLHTFDWVFSPKLDTRRSCKMVRPFFGPLTFSPSRLIFLIYGQANWLGL
jgi:hypothetical protein